MTSRPTLGPLYGAIAAHYKIAGASSKLRKVNITCYLNREVMIVFFDVPPTTAIHADDRLVEPRQPNEMLKVEEVAVAP